MGSKIVSKVQVFTSSGGRYRLHGPLPNGLNVEMSMDVIVQCTQIISSSKNTIEGSWIEMEPVFVDSPEFYGEVYYGGITRRKMNLSIRVHADAKTGAVIDLYKIG